MAQETIVLTQGRELPPDILALGERMKPAGFTLHTLPGNASAADIATAMREAEYLLGFVRYLPDDAYAQAPRLKLVQVLSAGYDQVNIAGARKVRVPICANGGANSVAVAEHTLLLILAVYRKLTALHQNVAGGHWHDGIPRTVDIYELEGKTVGLLGLGNIGQQVAKRVQAFDANVIYYDTFRRSPDEEARLGVEYVPFHTLLETADVVSLHVPLNDQTRHMIDGEALGRMKPKAILVNTCRGEVVDEAALIEALQQARIMAAGLDTQEQEPADPANPLLTLPNVTLTPHTAGPTVDSFTKRFRNGYANIERVANGQVPMWVIPEMHDLFPPQG
ncbi:MAG: lactate dehydrogenase [Candidatus Tectomicrobia bacterium]|uniref:Lactate dehydrogenase n=1 Tax=Tectimicrobiota bacterium TaxID=2528274 RepID=A0A937W0P6_UNCTE|nr:lactate dehydrogenase [Candidatus Tectomicrobia bacterium]